MGTQIKIFSPATVANVSCGFDALGFALESLGDEMIFTTNDSGKICITKIEGARLPVEIDQNAAGVVAQQMLIDAGVKFGIDIEIYKKYKPGSGLGSSAASSSGTAFAVNELLGNRFSKLQLVQYAMLGEEVACGAPIADNASAALYGGFVLVRSYDPLDIISIPTPANLYVTIIHPQIELKTSDGRDVLPQNIPLKNAITQWANVGGLISGLYSSDYELIARSVKDVIVEPFRKVFIPHFDTLQQECISQGALAVGISGSGPSVFALSKGESMAKKIAEVMDIVYKDKGMEYRIYVSKIGNRGAKIIPS